MSNSFYTNVQVMGNSILFRGLLNGKRIKKRLPFKPKLYVKSNKPSKYQSLFGEALEQIEFGDINDSKEFIEKYKEVPGFKIYGNTRNDYAFIAEMFQGDIDWDISRISIAYLDIEVGSDNGFPDPDHAHEPITAITLYINNEYHVFGCGQFSVDAIDNPSFKADKKLIIYHSCQDEVDLLTQFVTIWVQYMPDVVTGWNINMFDIPYIVNRMKRLFLDDSGEVDLVKSLSPWGWVKPRVAHLGKKEINMYDVHGISILDYLDLYKKYPAPITRESYKLDFIGELELGVKKLDYSEYGDLNALYRTNYQKFIEYNIQDVTIVLLLEEKNRLIELALTLAYDSKVNYDDVFSQVRMWDTIIYNFLLGKNIIIPPKKEGEKKKQFVGAYVKEPIVGMYHWLASFDFTSLYPHLIMTYNISPETLIEPVDYDDEMREFLIDNAKYITIDGLLSGKVDTSICQRKNISLTPNGQFFRRDRQGFLPALMDKMYKDRAAYQGKMNEGKKKIETNITKQERHELDKVIARYHNLQWTKKICLNSAFGAVGNQYFRFFDVRLAEAITMSAQLSVLWIQKHINEYMNKTIGTTNVDYVVASDTDSVYLNMGELVNKAIPIEKQQALGTLKIIRMMDKLCVDLIQPFIDKSCKNLSDYVNAYQQRLNMKREALCDKGIWTGKKHYMINVWNNEGIEYAKPKLKVVGMEAIKSSTPSIVRKKLKDTFALIMEKDELTVRKFINDFKSEFFAASVQDISFPRGMNNLEEYSNDKTVFSSGTPIHVKGALIFNNQLKQRGLLKKYPQIKEGEKLKFVYLKQPNPLQATVISYATVIPEEFGLDGYLDYEMMYAKTYVDPISDVLDAIGWSIEEKSSLESLFG